MSPGNLAVRQAPRGRYEPVVLTIISSACSANGDAMRTDSAVGRKSSHGLVKFIDAPVTLANDMRAFIAWRPPEGGSMLR